MRAGGLDERIVIEHYTESRNEYGEVTKTWATLATVWAKVIHQKGDESFAAAQVDATRTLKFKIRYRDDLDPTMRVQWRGGEYDIHDIDRSARRADELWITATAHNAK